MKLSVVLGEDKPELLQEETLAGIFRHTAKRIPGKTALIFGDKTVSYQALDEWSDAVAEDMQRAGVVPGSCVGIWLPRGLELHIAILATVKVGAAYIPLDIEMPQDRVFTVLSEVKAHSYFSISALALPANHLPISLFEQKTATTLLATVLNPDVWAYVLYTSGSTGKPKGIPITQRQICHFVRSENAVLQVAETDKVYQGFSVSFDMWCEEVWISYLVGATLWIADATTAKSIDDLGSVLWQAEITVFHAVPSLLAVMDDDIPSLRLVNAGGEACTYQVLSRWAIQGRNFYNSYGPTETTVTASITLLQPGDTITIGKPLPNYNMAVIDEQQNLLPIGEKGELIISGPGVGQGYIELPELTKQKFVKKPASMEALPGNVYYRTGDAAIINIDGSIDFQGRIDDQIKLRGYRIELGEIESKLSSLTDITAGAVAVKKDVNGIEHLVGYVVCQNPVDMNPQAIREQLAAVLPPYMIPSLIVTLAELPRLTSGKIDRKGLPVPAALSEIAATMADTLIDLDATLGERLIAALKKIFPNRAINLEQDFFTDLGGHSLLAATLVSKLRSEANIPDASLKDIYINRPLSKLANYWESKPKAAPPTPTAVFNEIAPARYWLCFIAQTMSLLLIYGLFAVQIFFPYLGYYYVNVETKNLAYSVATASGTYLFVPPFFSLLSIAVKWLVIGKMKEGDYPLWGVYYFRWWFVKTFQRLLPSQFLNGTPLYAAYLRNMGVKIGKDAQVGALNIGAEDLLTIGEDVSISSSVIFNNAVVENGLLKLRKISVGNHAYLGSSAIVAGNTTISDWGELQDLSYLPEGATIKRAECWQGSPASCQFTRSEAQLQQPLKASGFVKGMYRILFLAMLLVFPFLILIPLLPTIIVLNDLDNATSDYDFSYLVVTPSLALSYILIFAGFVIVLNRLLLKNIKPGTYSIYSWVYVRKWFSDQLITLSLVVLHPIYATVFVSSWFRALGAKVGKYTEISTASNVSHPLLEIGSDAFVADAVSLGEADVRGQQLVLEKTVIGNNSFVGNSALIPQGYKLGERMLIGVLSTPPSAEQLAVNEAKDWLGSPAIPLPRRQESKTFSAGETFRPKAPLILTRSIIEFIRILIPETTILICSILFIAYGHDLVVNKAWWETALYLPYYYLFFMGMPAFLLTVVLKWVLIGKYKPEQKPMWHIKVWLTEAITSTYEALSVPFLLDFLRGTPWLPMALRLLGVKIGKKVWMNTTDVTEYDMVEIGDNSALNEDCGPQTHLFEDRVMKVGKVKIGSKVSIGARTIILYDSEIGNNSKVAPLSLVMKGETIPPNAQYGGSPVKRS